MVERLNAFARDVGLLSGMVGYDAVVDERARRSW
jgi:hypothetical protein